VPRQSIASRDHGEVLEYRIGQHLSAHFLDILFDRFGILTSHVEVDHSVDANRDDIGVSQVGQSTLDGGPLGISDLGASGDLHGDLHRIPAR